MTKLFPDRTPIEQTDNREVYHEASERGFSCELYVCVRCGDPIVTTPSTEDDNELLRNSQTVLKPCRHYNPDKPKSVVPPSFEVLDDLVGETVTADADPEAIRNAHTAFAAKIAGVTVDELERLTTNINTEDKGEADTETPEVDPDDVANGTPEQPRLTLPEKGTLSRSVLDYLIENGPATSKELQENVEWHNTASIQATASALTERGLVGTDIETTSKYTLYDAHPNAVEIASRADTGDDDQ